MNTDTKIIIGAAAVSILIIVGGIVMFANTKPAPEREKLGSATMAIDKKNEDIGSMKVSDERSATFTITNTSDSILRIWNISTSCNCTAASVTISGTTTGEFNMPAHMGSDLKNWIGEVQPNQTAVLKATYRPSIMPVQGPITRQVNFSTNDPNNQDVQVSIAANVL